MLNIEIKGLGAALPEKFVEFQGRRRYRMSDGETHLGLLCKSAKKVLKQSNMKIDDIDVIIGACAVGVQPIPCTAALVHEEIAKGKNIPAFDVNSTCTSFIAALDIASYYIHCGRYRNVLIVSGDAPSLALNENERHSFELFGDGAVSAVITPSKTSGILYCTQLTYSSGAHLTELEGGGTLLPGLQYCEDNKHRFQFHMEGKKALTTTLSCVNELFDDIKKHSKINPDDIHLIIPHQASEALSLVMRRLNIPTNKFIDLTKEYGNMVSASIPFTLDYAIRQNKVKHGDLIMLLGTAAGLTLHAMIMRY